MGESIQFLDFLNGSIFLTMLLATNSIADTSDHSSSSLLSSKGSDFILCNNFVCNQAKYYVGYNRTNSATLSGEKLELPPQEDMIFPNTANIADKKILPDIDEQLIDLRDGNFVSSLHRVDNAQIGFSQKSELMNIHSSLDDSKTEATVKLFWGDKFLVTSDILQKGTSVTIVIKRTVDGFGNPVTDNAFYNASSQTFFNGKPVGDLDFKLKKEPGKDQEDQISGEAEIKYNLKATIGDIFTIESLMKVVDGVKVDPMTHQILNGADSVRHEIMISDKHSDKVCLLSASGVFNAGNCQ